MDVIAVCAFAVISVVLCKTVESDARDIKLLMVIGGAAIIFLKAAGSLGGIIAEIRSLFVQSDVDPEYVRILLKGLGVCYVTNFTVSICRDSGENTLADQTLLAGKVALLIISLPMLEGLIEIVKTLMV